MSTEIIPQNPARCNKYIQIFIKNIQIDRSPAAVLASLNPSRWKNAAAHSSNRECSTTRNTPATESMNDSLSTASAPAQSIVKAIDAQSETYSSNKCSPALPNESGNPL